MFAGLRSRWMIPARARLRAPRRSVSRSAALRRSGSRHARSAATDRRPHQLHDERVDAVRLLEAVDDRDVRMVERGQDAGFALEPCETVRIGGERLRQDLDRDVAIELRVTRPVDLPHAAFANLRRDHIRPERLADPDPPADSIRHGRGTRGTRRHRHVPAATRSHGAMRHRPRTRRPETPHVRARRARAPRDTAARPSPSAQVLSRGEPPNSRANQAFASRQSRLMVPTER